jgi:hypothetical protein
VDEYQDSAHTVLLNSGSVSSTKIDQRIALSRLVLERLQVEEGRVSGAGLKMLSERTGP